MVDITKCSGEKPHETFDGLKKKCSVRVKCYRYTATSSQHWQSMMNTPINMGKNCSYFICNGVSNK